MDYQGQGVSDSPNSSEEVESHHGTPATKLSVFSPENVRTEYKASAYAVGESSLPPTFSLRPVPGKCSPKDKARISSVFGGSDPFTTTSTASFSTQSLQDAPKLSPIASSFMPMGLQGIAVGNVGANTSTGPSPTYKVEGTTPTLYSPKAPLERNTATSQPELKELLYSITNTALVSPTNQSSASSLESSSPEIGRIEFGQFSSESNVSRHLMITQVARNTSVEEFDTLFNVSKRHLGLQFVVNRQ